MGKLVRDRIPDIIAAEGRTPTVRPLNDQEYEVALLDKLLEEATELQDAEPHQVLEEAADVYEVLLAILAQQGIGADELAAAATRRRVTRGAFTQRWCWEGN
jgi:predicted house-cleaning noncanonical NTP pyrophosphatase (MazG superfamily)